MKDLVMEANLESMGLNMVLPKSMGFSVNLAANHVFANKKVAAENDNVVQIKGKTC